MLGIKTRWGVPVYRAAQWVPSVARARARALRDQSAAEIDVDEASAAGVDGEGASGRDRSREVSQQDTPGARLPDSRRRAQAGSERTTMGAERATVGDERTAVRGRRTMLGGERAAGGDEGVSGEGGRCGVQLAVQGKMDGRRALAPLWQLLVEDGAARPGSNLCVRVRVVKILILAC